MSKILNYFVRVTLFQDSSNYFVNLKINDHDHFHFQDFHFSIRTLFLHYHPDSQSLTHSMHKIGLIQACTTPSNIHPYTSEAECFHSSQILHTKKLK